MNEELKEHWDREWERRFDKSNGSMIMNTQKYSQLCDLLAKHDFSQKYILEIGCGCGTMIKRFNWPHYVGMDYSQKGIENAIFLNPDKQFICGDILTYQFNTRQFDVFLALDVLEHVDDLSVLAQQVKTIASPGAVFISNIPLWQAGNDDPIYEKKVTVEELIQFHVQAGFPNMNMIVHYTKASTPENTIYLPFLYAEGRG